MLDRLTCNDFVDKIDQAVPVKWGDRSEVLTLVEAKELPVRGTDPASVPRQPFSLLLTGSTEWAPQGTYPFDLPGIGEVALFVVPVGPTRDGTRMQYQVLFA